MRITNYLQVHKFKLVTFGEYLAIVVIRIIVKFIIKAKDFNYYYFNCYL